MSHINKLYETEITKSYHCQGTYNYSFSEMMTAWVMTTRRCDAYVGIHHDPRYGYGDVKLT